ncbi:hypothetical protein KM043_001018 [Ampulex compressa]|nr:hypothetical protein KM043_001018 [Ampulex compressa]
MQQRFYEPFLPEDRISRGTDRRCRGDIRRTTSVKSCFTAKPVYPADSVAVPCLKLKENDRRSIIRPEVSTRAASVRGNSSSSSRYWAEQREREKLPRRVRYCGQASCREEEFRRPENQPVELSGDNTLSSSSSHLPLPGSLVIIWL